ncbi:hypothetical protein XA68_16063 [Ophiocordyceps unilateralis]|uniref:Uncharacterized protein n=1 Tax=Ophiocordyceps unilateralis TaxID=268505 RepID=A0A2A9PLR4_OPHUN|nr:hypothetical protein XA68_16063 [Ophiocordyceps unilateralis]
MCNYIYKELSCQHHYHLVESWCSKYIETERRCPPTVVSKQYWGNDICCASFPPPPGSSCSCSGLLLSSLPILHDTDAWQPAAACRERQQPSNHPWAKLIRRPSPNMAPYPHHVSAQ